MMMLKGMKEAWTQEDQEEACTGEDMKEARMKEDVKPCQDEDKEARMKVHMVDYMTWLYMEEAGEWELKDL